MKNSSKKRKSKKKKKKSNELEDNKNIFINTVIFLLLHIHSLHFGSIHSCGYIYCNMVISKFCNFNSSIGKRWFTEGNWQQL